MNEIGKPQKNESIISTEDQNELRQVTDALLAEDSVDLAERQSMSVPIESLASLGAAVSSLSPALRTATGTTTLNMKGVYTLANASVGDTLKVAKDGNFWGAFKTAKGKSKFVKLQEAKDIGVSTTTTLPIDPATMMMAVALHSIDQKLDAIAETQKQILEFLSFEKESEIEADVQMLSSIVEKYKLNWDNEHYVASNHKMVLDIQRTALKNMRIYQKQVTELLEKKQLLVAQNNVESTFADMQKLFKYYRMALYTYSLSSLLEIMLSGNFKEDYINRVKTEIEQFAMDYRNFFDKASIQLENLSSGAFDTKVLKGLGTVAQTIGKSLSAIPGVNKGPLDELLQERGNRLTDKASVLEERAVCDFAELSNPGTAVLTGRMQDMIQIFNHTDHICFDRDNIYLVG